VILLRFDQNVKQSLLVYSVGEAVTACNIPLALTVLRNVNEHLHIAIPIEAVNIPGGVHLLYNPMPHNSLRLDWT
jgi:hypothetical protein